MFSSERDAVKLKTWEPFSWPNVNREWGEEADLWNSPGEGGLSTPREPLELLLGRVNLTRDPKGETEARLQKKTSGCFYLASFRQSQTVTKIIVN